MTCSAPLAVSEAVLGCLGLLLLALYLSSCPDDGVRLCSRQLVSKTVSLLCAVLIFGSCSDALCAGLAGRRDSAGLLVDMGQLVLWLTIMQALLAPRAAHPEPRRTSWALLFAHLAGFAGAAGWGCLQQAVLRASPFAAFCAVPLGFAGLSLMFIGYGIAAAMGSGSKGATTDELGLRYARSEVMGLSLSFVTAQAILFSIRGSLPSRQGFHVEESLAGSLLDRAGLASCSLLLMLMPAATPQLPRPLRSFLIYVGAWCLWYGSRPTLSLLAASQYTWDPELFAAMVVSLCALCLMPVVRQLCNCASSRGEETAGADCVLSGLALVVGLSWQECLHDLLSVASRSSACEVAAPICLAALILLVRSSLVWASQQADSPETASQWGAESTPGRQASSPASELDQDIALAMQRVRELYQRRPPGLKHLRVSARGLAEVP